MIITYEKEEKALDYVIKKLTEKDSCVIPWFKTEEEAEEWMGDIFCDAVQWYLESILNEEIIYINEKEENKNEI